MSFRPRGRPTKLQDEITRVEFDNSFEPSYRYERIARVITGLSDLMDIIEEIIANKRQRQFLRGRLRVRRMLADIQLRKIGEGDKTDEEENQGK